MWKVEGIEEMGKEGFWKSGCNGLRNKETGELGRKETGVRSVKPHLPNRFWNIPLIWQYSQCKHALWGVVYKYIYISIHGLLCLDSTAHLWWCCYSESKNNMGHQIQAWSASWRFAGLALLVLLQVVMGK